MSDSLNAAGMSMRGHIALLSDGESFARCQRLAINRLTRERIARDTNDLRNTINAAMRRAANDTGNEYTIDTGHFLTAGRDLMLVAVVTRTA